MAIPTIEQIRETSDRTTDRLIELQRRREARQPTTETDSTPRISPRSIPWLPFAAIALAAGTVGIMAGAAFF